MDIWNRFSGVVRVRVTTADPERFINEAFDSEIELQDIHCTNDLNVIACVNRKSYGALKKLVERRGYHFRVENRYGVYFWGKYALSRPVFVLLICFLMLLVICFPTRIYFVRVEGNSSLPERLYTSLRRFPSTATRPSR